MLSIPKPRAPALPLLLLIAVTLWTSPARGDPNAPCYFPGGDLAPGYFPCIAYGAPVTSCCAPGWTCFSNSLCIATTESRSFPNISLGAVQRGACTAPKWNNEFCGSVCLTGDNADGRLAACGSDRYCCWADFAAGKCGCGDGQGAFVVDPGLAQTIVQVTDTSYTGLSPSVSIATAPPTPVKTTNGAGAMTTGGGEGGSKGPGPTNTAGTGGGGEGEGVNNGGDGNGDGETGDEDAARRSRNLKIGLGVAIPVAVILVGSLAGYFLWKRHQDRVRARAGGAIGTGLAENNEYGPQVETSYYRQNT